MIGAGQLARMTHQAAIALGQSLRVLAAGPGDPAAQVTPDVRLGAATDLAALRELARGCAAVTLDHEQVPQEHLRALVAEGVTVHPRPDALLHAQDKLVMRRRLVALGIPGPRFAEITAPEDLVEFGATAVLKAVRGGYDGRGVWLDPTPELVAELLAAGTPVDLAAAWPAELRRHYGEAFSIARRLAGLLTLPRLLPVAGPVGMRSRALMTVALRVMGNLVTDEDRDLTARAWRTAGRLSLRLDERPPFT